MRRPELIPPKFVERPWGVRNLQPFYPDSDRNIGEVWFQHPEVPLLIKFVFTDQPLSVQVHPGQDYAQLHEKSNGKTEMWHILRASADARIALGFAGAVTKQQLRAAAQSGEFEQLLHWVKPSAGETYFTPAGTVHAIGGGIALCEIQQLSDITYRIFDYGRGRELHLDKALDVAILDAHTAGPASLPICCEFFQTEQVAPWEPNHPATHASDSRRPHLLMILEGEGELAGAPYRAGQTWFVPACESYSVTARQRTTALKSFVP